MNSTAVNTGSSDRRSERDGAKVTRPRQRTGCSNTSGGPEARQRCRALDLLPTHLARGQPGPRSPRCPRTAARSLSALIFGCQVIANVHGKAAGVVCPPAHVQVASRGLSDRARLSLTHATAVSPHRRSEQGAESFGSKTSRAFRCAKEVAIDISVALVVMAGFFPPLLVLGLIVVVPTIWWRRKKRRVRAAAQANVAPPQQKGDGVSPEAGRAARNCPPGRPMGFAPPCTSALSLIASWLS
jgi:hypothetical protein